MKPNSICHAINELMHKQNWIGGHANPKAIKIKGPK